VVVVVLYLVGIYEGRGQGYKKRKAEEEKEKQENLRAPTQTVTVKVDDPGLMRIKNENGQLTLDLDGARVDTTAFSTDQRKRLIEIISLIRPWLESKPAPAPVVAPQTQAQPQHLQRLTPTPPAPPPVQPLTPPSLPTSPASKPATIAKEDRPSTSATSIVGQIDSVLQERLAGTPLEARGIFLTESPDGGVMVYVGLTKYQAIDDVPDAEVVTAIRAAITEWENRFTPGLK
jgi:hypothetical protein